MEPEQQVILLHQERLDVTKVSRITGSMNIRTRVVTEDVPISEILTSTFVDVQRQQVNQYIDAVPLVRIEGDVTIIPVIEEVFVKRILLKEEIRIKRVTSERLFEDVVKLRKEVVDVSRTEKGIDHAD